MCEPLDCLVGLPSHNLVDMMSPNEVILSLLGSYEIQFCEKCNVVRNVHDVMNISTFLKKMADGKVVGLFLRNMKWEMVNGINLTNVINKISAIQAFTQCASIS